MSIPFSNEQYSFPKSYFKISNISILYRVRYRRFFHGYIDDASTTVQNNIKNVYIGM